MSVRTTLSGTAATLVSLVTLVTPEMVETALVREYNYLVCNHFTVSVVV